MPAAISARAVTRFYGPVRALDGVDLDVETGEVFALLGPNGAGKTTFVEILEGYRHRSGGDVSVLGTDPDRADARWRSRIGIVLQSAGTFDAVTVRELVDHFASAYPAPMPVDRVLGLVGLQDRGHVRIGRLSGGQRRRVDLALGIVGDPELVFLDEPTTGFDPAARSQAWDVVRSLAGLGKTVLLTTHYLDEAESLAARVGVIVAGRLVALGTPRDLGGRDHALASVRVALSGSLEGQIPPAEFGAFEVANGVAELRTDRPTATVAALAAWTRGFGFDEIPGLEVTRPSLEEVYLDMIAAHMGATGPVSQS